MAECLALLAKHSSRPAADRLEFLRRLIFVYLIGNADAHGKNAALLYKDGKIRLAPAYDLLCTAVYPTVSQKMAMKIGGQYDADTLCLRHWHQLVPDTALARKALQKDLLLLAKTTQEQAVIVHHTLQAEGHDHPILEKILGVIRLRASQVLREIPAN